MNTKTIYLVNALFSLGLLILFLACFILFLNDTTTYLGFESYIYWLVYQITLTIITFYQYKVSTFSKKTSIKMSALFMVPVLLFALFIWLNLGEINLNPVLFGIYITLFTLTGLSYLIPAFITQNN